MSGNLIIAEHSISDSMDIDELLNLPSNIVTNFIVENSDLPNTSVVYLSPTTMNAQKIWYGVAILLHGKNDLKTASTVLTDENCGDDKIRMNRVVRKKLGVALGDSVSIGNFKDIPNGKNILVRPIRDKVDKRDFNGENLFEAYLRPYFFEAYRPVHEGDVFVVHGPTRMIKFKVLNTEPSPFCIVMPATIIDFEGQISFKKRRQSDEPRVVKKLKLKKLLGLKNISRPSTSQSRFPIPENVVTKTEANCVSEAIPRTPLQEKIELAHSLREQGKLEEARKLFVKILQTYQTEPGPSRPTALEIKQTLATILFDLQRTDDVIKMFLEDPELRESSDPPFLDTKLAIAMTLADKGRFNDSVDILSEGLGLNMSLNFSFIEILKIKIQLATVLFRQGNWQDALKLLSEKKLAGPIFHNKNSKFIYALDELMQVVNMSVAADEEAHENNSSRVSNVLYIKSYIGWFYYVLGEYRLATRVLEEVLPLMKEDMGIKNHYCHHCQEILNASRERLPEGEQRPAHSGRSAVN